MEIMKNVKEVQTVREAEEADIIQTSVVRQELEKDMDFSLILKYGSIKIVDGGKTFQRMGKMASILTQMLACASHCEDSEETYLRKAMVPAGRKSCK